jgi:hypothetical protein
MGAFGELQLSSAHASALPSPTLRVQGLQRRPRSSLSDRGHFFEGGFPLYGHPPDGSREGDRFNPRGSCRSIGPQQLQEPNMRTLLAVTIVMSSVLAVSAAADAAHKYRRSAERSSDDYAYGAYPRFSREQVECERARHEDPTGLYGGYPCWARDAFGSGSNRGRRR